MNTGTAVQEVNGVVTGGRVSMHGQQQQQGSSSEAGQVSVGAGRHRWYLGLLCWGLRRPLVLKLGK
jgi:hypothetical protein